MTRNVHLLVCIHGLWGNPDNLAELARFVRAKYPIPSDDADLGPELDILVIKSNADDLTYDGVDWGAERVADEVEAHITSTETEGTRKVSRFSLIGYSFGGLLGRYLIGMLHARGFFNNVEPYNFITISTPHVGLPRYPGVLSACFNAFGPQLLSRTGKQFFFLDEWSTSRRPLLEVMADNESIFFKALSLFPHIEIYANAVNDLAVPYLTAAIEVEDPFVTQKGLKIELDEQYAPIITTFTPTESPPPRSPLRRLFSGAFFRSLKPKPLLIPVPVSVQLLIWVFFPIVLPGFFTYAVTRLYLESRASQARIIDLERAYSSAALLDSLSIPEKHTTHIVSAVIDTSSSIPSSSPKGKISPHTNPPCLSSKQISLVASLNSLPQLRKHVAFIDGIFNTHGVIVCRDVEDIKLHRRGEGVLRHIADVLVI